MAKRWMSKSGLMWDVHLNSQRFPHTGAGAQGTNRNCYLTGSPASNKAQPAKEDKVAMSLPSSGRSREDHRERRGVAQALWDRVDSS